MVVRLADPGECRGGGGGRLIRLRGGRWTAAKGFDGVEEGGAGLLAEDLAEQRAERADVAAEGCGFELGRAGFELGEAIGPAGGGPKGRHGLIMLCGGWAGVGELCVREDGRLVKLFRIVGGCGREADPPLREG